LPLDKARAYAEQATAENTQRAYKADWYHFLIWCAGHNAQHMPADVATIAAYLADCADSFKLSTIERRLVTISKTHQMANMPNPAKTEAIHLTMKGIRRALGRA
jgi:site-specific recombinase XerD